MIHFFLKSWEYQTWRMEGRTLLKYLWYIIQFFRNEFQTVIYFSRQTFFRKKSFFSWRKWFFFKKWTFLSLIGLKLLLLQRTTSITKKREFSPFFQEKEFFNSMKRKKQKTSQCLIWIQIWISSNIFQFKSSRKILSEH